MPKQSKLRVWHSAPYSEDLAENEAAFIAIIPGHDGTIAVADKYAQLFETAPEMLAFLKEIMLKVKPQHALYKKASSLYKKASK